MGKASSSKKVARAARSGTGPRVSGGQPRSFLFPGVLTLVVVLGMLLVVFARADRQSQDMGGTPQFGDHIHLALGIQACGEWLPDLPSFESRTGIHTHGDGLIHVHPFSGLGVGANSTLDRYMRDVRTDGGLDFEVTNDRLSYQNREFQEGDAAQCDGIDDPQLRLAYWDNVTDPDAAPRIISGDFGSLRLDTDGAGITVFYGDPGAEIEPPPSAAQLPQVSPGLDSTIPPDADIVEDDPEAVDDLVEADAEATGEDGATDAEGDGADEGDTDQVDDTADE